LFVNPKKRPDLKGITTLLILTVGLMLVYTHPKKRPDLKGITTVLVDFDGPSPFILSKEKT